MPFGFGKSKVQMTVINADDGKIIVKAAQLPEDIPESFDKFTTIHLGENEFQVVEADPLDRVSYTKSGKLTLKVRKVEEISTKDILFSLPTICDYIGATIPTDRQAKQIFEMHEDDWRQVELISKALLPKIDTELASITEIYSDQRNPSGFFQKLHVRSLIKEPIDESSKLTLSRLKSQLKSTTTFDGIGYYTSGGPTGNGIVENGFAFEGAGGLIVYGQVSNDLCTMVGITASHVDDPVQTAAVLASLINEFDLVFVDWCRASTIESQAQIELYFEYTRG
jgi:hypothetical protein